MRWSYRGFLFENSRPLPVLDNPDRQRLLELRTGKRKAHYLLSRARFAE